LSFWSYLLTIVFLVFSFDHNNGQKKRPKKQWSKDKSKKTMVKRKDQKYNVFLVFSFDHCIFGLFF
jgi:hypothetical protein